MLKNYFKIAWRNLARNKSYAFINIGGLAVALAVFLSIILFVRHELNYDSFFSNSDQIYRIAMINDEATSSDRVHLQVPEPIGGELKELYPEVVQSVRVTGPYGDMLLEGQNKVYSDGWASVGNSFFNIFDFPFIAGNPSTALDNPQSVVVTRALAQKLFGTTDALGKNIINNNDKTYTITGVIKDLPSNTHFKIEAFAYRKGYDTARLKKWNYYTGKVYLKFGKPGQGAAFQKKLPDYVKEHQNFTEGMKGNYRLVLQPVSDIHLHPRSREAESSRLFYIQVLLIVAGLILLVACINYMNMATARSARRAREIGIRKAVGAYKRQVITQVMLESVMTCFLAFLFSLILVELFKPLSLRYFDISLGSGYHFTPGWIGFLAGMILLVSFLSGSYAAFYLASFQPSDVLKGAGNQSGKRSALFRKILVVAQFGISIAIVIASLLISKQMGFVRTERLNGNDAQVMVIQNNSPNLEKKFGAFKNELLKSNAIASVSAGTIPTQVGMKFSFEDSIGNTTTVYNFQVQYDYFKTMGLHLLSGRSFDPARSQDSTMSIILNKSYAQALGLKQAKGQPVPHSNGKLIGIVQDFHSQTLFDPIKPVRISLTSTKEGLYRSTLSPLLIRLKKDHIAQGIAEVRSVWSDFVPAYPLNFSFLNQVLDQDYRAELRLAKIFDVFSVFSILIACLGLFGLAAFAANRRTKEIGVRKVLGATVSNIVGLLSKDFLKLVIIGFVIAVPIAWYAMNKWLADFAYKITITPWIFLLAGGLALLIALATVSWQSIRAALANPVDSLRSE